MSKTLEQVRALVGRGDVRVSLHGYEELASDGILAREVIEGLESAIVVEDYPDYPKGARVLVLEQDRANQPIHAVWVSRRVSNVVVLDPDVAHLFSDAASANKALRTLAEIAKRQANKGTG